jgi:chromosomal replication initiator protein
MLGMSEAGGAKKTTMSDRGALADQWERVKDRLRAEIGDASFRHWVHGAEPAGFDDGEVQLVVPNRMQRDRVRNQYADRIRALWSRENPAVVTVDVVVAKMASPPALPFGLEAVSAVPADRLELEAVTLEGPVDPLGDGGRGGQAFATVIDGKGDPFAAIAGQLDPRFTFDNFVQGKSNELALAAARRVAESATVTFNPLFLYGGVGLGKTHLMHAIAHEIRRRAPGRRVLYMSAEKFMYQFIRALRFKDTMAFKELFRSVDVLMIDDVQFISGKDSTQEEFFHTFNALVDQNHQVIISADKSPSDLDGMEDRLKSRLGWGLVADIHPTNYELRLGILHARCEQVGLSVPGKVLEFLAHKITSNVRELEGALNRLGAHAQLVGREITVEVAQDLLTDLLRANDRRVTIEEIQKKVAEHYTVRVSDMYSSRRSRSVARPRQVAMYLSKRLTSKSLPEIGKKFGGRDHTTVMHAVKKVEELIGADPVFAEDVDLLRRMLES